MLEELQKELSKFGKAVIKQSRANLTRKGNNDTKDLYNSLKFESKVHKNSFSFDFFMEDYGTFRDLGVKGKKSSSKAPNSPYRFGSGTGKKGGLTEAIGKWVRSKGIRGRGKNGRFITHKSLTFLITRSIYNNGMKPSLFFTKPFEKAFERLPEDLIEKFGLDVENFMEHTLNKK
tara:strand:+ start:111 stop:635 length:525 start_codon:yes stop_codon:yes gene_type:complete